MKDSHMQGKIVLVTGATSGIGRATARALADRGATVVFTARDRAKADATRQWIVDGTRNPSIEYLLADLSSQEQVLRLAREFGARYSGLDVLINNAGGLFMKRMESVDGIEMTLALNHLAPFLLTNLLLGALKGRTPSRIITVSSRAHENARMDFDDLEARTGYSGWRAYGQSKLANLLFTYELARRLEGSGVTANALHPGFVATSFGRNNGGAMGAVLGLAQRLGAIRPEEGAKTSVYLASSPDVQGTTGTYFTKMQPVASSAASVDRESQRRLWETSVQMTRVKVEA